MQTVRYLITGGAGFIGSNLAHHLVAQDARVRILDNLSTGRMINLDGILDRVEFVEGDIREYEAVSKAMVGVDYVLHQAAIPSVQRSVEDPQTSLSVAVEGTLNVLQAARRAEVKRVVYAASSSAYGDTEVLPKVESLRPMPMSPYAVGKLAGEHLCAAYYHCHGLQTLSLRYFNVFGPRQDPSSQYAAVIPNFIGAFLRGERPVIFGDGLQSRDFTFVQNVVEANLMACRLPRTEGQVINIACGSEVSLLTLLDLIGRIFNKTIEPVHKGARPGDIRRSWADIEAARRLMDFKVRVSLDEGLARTVEYYRATPQGQAV